MEGLSLQKVENNQLMNTLESNTIEDSQNSQMSIGHFLDQPDHVDKIKSGQCRISYKNVQKDEYIFQDRMEDVYENDSMEGSFLDDDEDEEEQQTQKYERKYDYEEEKVEDQNTNFGNLNKQKKAQANAITQELLMRNIQKQQEQQLQQELNRNFMQNNELDIIEETLDENIESFTLRNLATGKAIKLDETSQKTFIFNEDNLEEQKEVQMQKPQKQEIEETKKSPDKKKKKKTSVWDQQWVKQEDNNNKLLDATLENDSKTIRELFDESNLTPPAINARFMDQFTCLHYAARENCYEAAQELLKFGSNISLLSSMNRTPLMYAVLGDHQQIVKLLLLQKNINVNIQDKEQNTCAHFASENGFHQILQLILAKKPNLKLKNDIMKTPYQLAPDTQTQKCFHESSIREEDYQLNKNQYGRTVFGNRIIKNSRQDMIQNLMRKSKMTKTLIQSPDKIEKVTRSQSQQHFEEKMKKKIDKYLGQIKEIQIWQDNPKIGPSSFVLHLLLGQGSFGEVYLVQKKDSKEFYAMKVLKKHQVFKQNLKRYVKAEKDILTIVNHPFIVNLNYAFQDNKRLYMLLDYCPGGDLGAIMLKQKRIKEDVVRIYAAEIILALECLHQHKIVYRDLKPENIVLDKDGHCLMTDFGLSKQGISNNETTSFCGSIAYMAPEILNRSGHNRTVDWYLLGVMLYELITGRPPYYNPQKEKLFKNILTAKLKFKKGITPEAKDLITQLMNRDPRRRLGFKNDASDVKKHQFFKHINWEDVLQRKYTPPKPKVKDLTDMGLPINFRKPQKNQEKRNYIEGWSFVEGQGQDKNTQQKLKPKSKKLSVIQENKEV